MSDKLDELIELATSERIKVVSFDIFDTLLLRPVVRPTDLFRLIAKKTPYQDQQFVNMRKFAEKIARKNKPSNVDDIELNDIYDNFSKMYNVSRETAENIKQSELEIEEKYLYTRKALQDVFYKALEAGKEVIITSDMYLPKSFLEKVLQKNGYIGYLNLYLSCECKVSKGTGKLYKKIVQDYAEKGISAKQIIHVGDNFSADVKQAEKQGLKTWFVPSAISILNSKRELKYLLTYLHSSTDNTFLVGFLANYLFDDPFSPYIPYSVINGRVENVGTIVAPLLLVFTKWMLEDAIEEKVDKLLFVYRDGYIPWKILNLLEPYYSNTPVINKIYLSRAIRYPYNAKCESGLVRGITDLPINQDMPVEDFIKNRLLVETEDDMQEILRIFLKNGYISSKSPMGKEDGYFPLISELEPYFVKNSEERIYTINEYCRSVIGDAGRVAVFDIGYRGSVSRFLKDNLCVDNIGYHIFATPQLNIDQKRFDLRSFIQYGFDVPTSTMILHPLMEDIISKQEGSAVNIVKENDHFTVIKEDVRSGDPNIKQIQVNILDFCEKFINMFGEDLKLLEFDYYNQFNFLVKFLNRPCKKDAQAISNLYFLDSSFISNLKNNVYKKWYLKFFPRVGVAIKKCSQQGKKDLLKKCLIKLHLFDLAKKVYMLIMEFYFKTRAGCTSLVNEQDYKLMIKNEIESSIKRIVGSELLFKSDNILVLGDMVSFDKGVCSYLNQLSQKISGHNLVLFSEATWLARERTSLKIDFPFFIVPEILGKNRFPPYKDIEVTPEMEQLIRENDYLTWAATNWKKRHHKMGRGYPEMLTCYAQKYYVQAFELLKPKCIIMWNAFHALHHVIDGIAKEKNIPVIYMEFGSLPGTFALDTFGQMGESYPSLHYEEFKNLEVSATVFDNVEKVWDYLKKSRLNRNIQPKNENISDIKSRIKPGRPIILYAGQNDYESGLYPYTEHTAQYHSPAYKSSDEAAEYLAVLAKKNDWNLIYKPHPIMVQIGCVKNVPKGAILVDNCDINDLIDLSDLTITILSQTGYISMIREKATLMLGYTQLKGKGCTYESFSKEETEEAIFCALENGMTAQMRENFKKHIAQMLKYYLYDDLLDRRLRYGKTLDDAVQAVKALLG